MVKGKESVTALTTLAERGRSRPPIGSGNRFVAWAQVSIDWRVWLTKTAAASGVGDTTRCRDSGPRLTASGPLSVTEYGVEHSAIAGGVDLGDAIVARIRHIDVAISLSRLHDRRSDSRALPLQGWIAPLQW